MTNPTYNPDPDRLIEAVKEMSLPEEVRDSIISSVKGQKRAGNVFMPAIIGGPRARQVGPRPLNFVIVLDSSSSLDSYTQEVRDLLVKLRDYAAELEIRDSISIQLAVVGFGSAPIGVAPYTSVSQIDPGIFNAYVPSGLTAMWDGMMYALLGDAGYGYELSKDGAKGGRYILTLLGDGYENNSKHFTAEDVRALLTETRKKRNRVFGAIGFGSGYLSRFMAMGFLERNIRGVGELGAGVFDEIFERLSKSMSAQSMRHSQAQAVNGPSDPGLMVDDMMFQS